MRLDERCFRVRQDAAGPRLLRSGRLIALAARTKTGDRRQGWPHLQGRCRARRACRRNRARKPSEDDDQAVQAARRTAKTGSRAASDTGRADAGEPGRGGLRSTRLTPTMARGSSTIHQGAAPASGRTSTTPNGRRAGWRAVRERAVLEGEAGWVSGGGYTDGRCKGVAGPFRCGHEDSHTKARPDACGLASATRHVRRNIYIVRARHGRHTKPFQHAPDRAWIFRTMRAIRGAEIHELYRGNWPRARRACPSPSTCRPRRYDGRPYLARGEVGKVGVPVKHMGDMAKTVRPRLPTGRD